MGLESLLARLENQIPATPKEEVQPLEHLEHQGTPRGVPGKPLQNNPGTPDTPRTLEIQQGWPDISKPDLAALAHPDDITLWWRIAITEPGGARTVEVDTPSGYTLADWQAYADRYHGPGCAVTPIAGLPKPPGAPANLDEALRTACEAVGGITPEQFRALPSPEDVADIEAGGIHPKTLHAYAESFAEGLRSGRIAALAGRKGAKPGLARDHAFRGQNS